MVMKKHRGALSELRACAWLLEQGYEVFRNVSDRGCIDVVALKDGETFYFDVKGSPNGIETRLTPEQDRAGILPLYVNASACWIGERYPYLQPVAKYFPNEEASYPCSSNHAHARNSESAPICFFITITAS